MPKIYSVKRSQNIPVSLAVAWNFFSKPENLKKVLPQNIQFNITSPLDSPVIYQGQIIEYDVKSMFGIHFKWVSEITEVETNQFFVDEQKAGLFSVWKHQHYFIEIPGGVEMTDILQYRFRFGFLGAILHALFVRKRIEQMFNFRAGKLMAIFGRYE